MQLTSSFLANIGPFAEFDITPPKATNEAARNKNISGHSESSSHQVRDTTRDSLVLNDSHSGLSFESSDQKEKIEKEAGAGVPEITVRAKCINFTIEPDDLPKHLQSLSNTQPFTVNIPNRAIEASFKVFDGKLDLLKIAQLFDGQGQGPGSSSGPRSHNSVSQASTMSMIREEQNSQEKENLIEKLQANEAKLIENLNSQTQKVDHLNVQNISLKNQVEMLEQQLRKSNQDRDEYHRNFETLIKKHMDLVKK